MPISISNRNRKALALSALGVLGAVANASAVTASADTTSTPDVTALLAKAKTLKASDTYKNTVNNVTMDLDDAIEDAEGMSSSANDSTKQSIIDELNDAIYAVSDPDNQRVSDAQKSEVSQKAAAVQKLKDSSNFDKYSEDLQEEIQNALDSVETFTSIPSVGNYNAAIGALKKANVDAEMEGSGSTSATSSAVSGNNSFASVASSAANAFHTALGILDSVSSGTDTTVGSSTASKASSSASNASSVVSNASSNASKASNASNAVNHTYYYDSMGKQIKNMTDGATPDIGGNNAPEGYDFIGSYTLTDKDVAEKGDFYGMGMNAGDVINLYNAKNASSNASSAASNAIVSAVSNAESSTSSAESDASSAESSNASSSASNISSAVSVASSAVSGSLSEVSSVASGASNASDSSSGASDSSSAAAINNVDPAVSSASSKAAKSSATPATQAVAGNTGSTGGAGATLPKTGSDAMSNAILAVMGLASTIGASSIILRKKRKEE